MLEITSAAGDYLEAMLKEENAPAGVILRLALDNSDLEFQLDRQRPGDMVLTHGNRPVLLLDEQLAELVEENMLAVEDHEDGDKLALI